MSRKSDRWIKILCLLSLVLIIPVFAQEKDEKIAVPPEVQAIDPFAEDAGDILDVDIMKEYGMKAYEAYNAQDYELAAQYYLAYLGYDIGAAGAIYNLACCYGLLGKESLAAEYLSRSFKAGFDDIEHIKRDPDFDKVRESKTFAAVMDSIVTIVEEEKAKEGKIVYIPSDAYFKCHVQLPADFDPEKSHTLLVGLHGFGASPESFIRLWERFGENPDFIYAAPQAPYAFELGDMGYSWDTWIPDDSVKMADVSKRTEQYVLDVIDYFQNAYNINKVFLTGFSQGGGYTYMIGIKNHEVFDGIMPLGGWLDSEWIGEEKLKAAKDLPVFIGHGEKDKRVEFKAAKKAKKTLKKLGYDVTFFTFDGGHAVPEEECQALVEWMKGLD